MPMFRKKRTPQPSSAEENPLARRFRQDAEPDTIDLRLELRTVGWSISGPGDWRERGFFLAVEPSNVGSNSLHRYNAWTLSETQLQVEWRLSDPPGGSIGLAFDLDSRGEEWRGVATLTLADRRDGPGKTYERSESRRLLARAINTMSEREKIVLTLYYYEGLTLAQIGEVLGVTESRVCQIHTKAILQLRSRMQAADRESV